MFQLETIVIASVFAQSTKTFNYLYYIIFISVWIIHNFDTRHVLIIEQNAQIPLIKE